MQYCRQCNMYHNESVKTCVACGSVLVNKKPLNTVIAPGYPPVKPHRQKYSIAAKIFILIGIIAALIVSFLNYKTFDQYPRLWSLIVIGGLIYIFLVVKQIIKDKHDYTYKTLVHLVMSSAILIILDIATGYTGWAISYTVPFILLFGTIVLPIVVAAKPSKYFLHVRNLVWLVLLDIVFYIITLATNLVFINMQWTGPMTLFAGLTLIIAMFLFAPKTTSTELFKFFRI